jgi:hypothetical protein
MLALAIALLSAGMLAYEILLTRRFAIEHFHHFAHMAIGVAMLGFGAAGTLVAIARPGPARSASLLRGAALATPLLLLLALAVSHRVPLDATQLLWDASQWGRLGLLYLALAAPLGAGATAILLALSLEPARVARLYAASFLGSALGAVLAIALLAALPLDRALAAPALLAAAAFMALAARRPGAAMPAALGALLLSSLAIVRPLWPIVASPYKGLPQVEALPGARRVAERGGPLGWMVAVRAPAFRHAPGLSLGYSGAIPSQLALFVDGELVGAVADWDRDSSGLLGALPSALPYALGGRERVLVLGAGGNTEVWNAAAHGAREIVAVELHPDVAALSRRPEPAGASVRWITGDARGVVARARERFDLVTMGPGSGPSAGAAGLHALGEDHLNTVEAYAGCLRRLRPGGVLAASCWMVTPPRESVRLVLALGEALRRSGGSTRHGLVVCRSWGTVTVLARPSGFSAAEVEGLRRWADERRFDVDWDPAIAAGGATPAARHNRLDDPALVAAARAVARGPDAAAAFARAYPFDVAPATDDRPYPGHFLRPESALQFARGDLGRLLPFAEWGLVAVIATLLQSAAVGAVLMLAPLVLRRGAAAGGRRFAVIGYFGAIGVGYMAAEIGAIPPLVLLLGHPVYAVTAVLAVLLACSGLGSGWSDRLAARRGPRVALGVAVALAAASAAFLPLAHAFQSAPILARAAAGLLALAPVALLMGMPFALGVRGLVAGRPDHLALAWASNGFASVVAAPLAALVALETGTRALLLLAAAAYAGAALLGRAGAASAAPAGARALEP